MKKVLTFLTVIFILLTTIIPAFAAECKQHDIIYPAEPAYTHEMGIDIYECSNCGHEMWHCKECDKYMPIEELVCTKCDKGRIAFSYAEQEQIDSIERNISAARAFTIVLICFAVAFVLTMVVCLIVF